MLPSIPLVLTTMLVLVVPSGAAEPAAGPARTLVVSLDGSGQYRSIQEAVDEAASGDTVQIKAGDYYEDVTIHSKQRLRLVGEGVDRVKVMGRNRVGAFHIGKWPYGATDIVVSDLTINSHGGLAMGIFNGRGLVLRHVRINGMLFGQQAGDVRVEDSVIGDSETTGVAFSDSQAVLVGNVIHDNDHGVTVAGKSDVRLERNVIVRNLFDGVIIADRSHGVLINNTIVKNGSGVAFVGTSDGEASGNIVGLNRIGFRIEPVNRIVLSYNGVFNAEHDYVQPDGGHAPAAHSNSATDLRADPHFVAPEADDFRLKTDSPLKKVGPFPHLGALPPLGPH